MAAFNAVAGLNPFTIIAVAIAAAVGCKLAFLQVKFNIFWTGMERYHGSMGQQLAVQRSKASSGAIGQLLAGLLVV